MRDDAGNPRDGIGPQWAALLDEFASKIGRVVARELRGEDPRLVDQALSPLGRRRHINAVRRRLAEGKLGASIVGRRFLLAQEALAEELGRNTPPPPATKPRSPKPGVKQARRRGEEDLDPVEQEMLGDLRRAGLRA